MLWSSDVDLIEIIRKIQTMFAVRAILWRWLENAEQERQVEQVVIRLTC